MKFIKYLVVTLLLLCCMPFVSCSGAADVQVSSRFDEVSWWLSKKTINEGDEVELAVSINEGYEGELAVYLNGSELILSGGYYKFTAEKTNKIEIDGDIYKSIDKIELPHSVLLVGQDFMTMNDSITVYYKTGDVENVKYYEVDNFPIAVGEKKVILTFLGGDHEYRRLVDVNILDEADYLKYVKSSFSAAVERDGVESLLATNNGCTVFQNDELLFYEDDEQKVWIFKDGMSYIASDKYLSHKFGSFETALTELHSHMPLLRLAVGITARSTYENIIGLIETASITTDEQGNIVLSRVDIDSMGEEQTIEYVLDSSLSYIISISRGDDVTSIVTDSEYDTLLPDDVEWTEF